MLNKLRNSLVLVDQAVFSGGSFLTTMLLARLLTLENFGVYSSILIIIYGAVSVFNAIIIQPLQVSMEQVNDKNKYIAFSFVIQLTLTFFLTLTLSILNNINIDFIAQYKGIISSASLFLIGFITHDYFRKLFLAKGEIKNALIIDTLSVLFTLLFIFYCFIFHLSRFDLILNSLGICYLPSIIISILFLKLKFQHFKNIYSFLYFQLNQAKWLLLTTLAQWWSSNLFVVASGYYLGVKALGAFRLVQSMFGLLNLVLQTFENFVLPESSRKLKESKEASKKYLMSVSKKAGLLFALVLAILFFFSDQAMFLFGGSKYIHYSYVIKGMSILYIFIFIGYPIRLSIRLLVLNKLFFIGYIISLIISIVSFNYLLKMFGINGAIIGLIISQLATMIFWQYKLFKEDFVLWK